MTRFSLRPALLPFGTLLTGSTIGTNNEKSTKVWIGDAENTPVELVAYNSNVEFQTYVGNGKHGSNNQSYRNQLTFSNVPKAVVIVIGETPATSNVIFTPGQTEYYMTIYTNNDYGASGKVSWTNDNKTVEWYCDSGSAGKSDWTLAMSQMNSNGVTYIAYAVY